MLYTSSRYQFITKHKIISLILNLGKKKCAKTNLNKGVSASFSSQYTSYKYSRVKSNYQLSEYMGNSIERKVSSVKKKFAQNEQTHGIKDNTIGIEFECPNCGIKFGTKSLQIQVHQHLTACLSEQAEQQPQKRQESEIIVPSKNEEISFNYNIEDYLYLKEPVDETFTKFVWKKAPIKVFQQFIFNMSPDQIKNLPFQEKSAWFRYHLERFRISWMSGADYMKIEKNNVLVSSLVQSKKVNMYKEVKIEFVGDKVNDAGGLLREWMHMVIKEMFDESTGIFQLCKTDDIMYKLKWDQDIDEEFSSELLILFGLILGKAIFQKISIGCYLDRTLLRQLLSVDNDIQLYDIFGYDKELYQNWNFLLNNQINDMGLQTYFVITKENSENSTLDVIQLIEGGQQIEVTDQNKKMYIDISVETMCKEKIMRSIGYLRKGLYKVVPMDLLRVFEPYELEMLIYGVPYIDVKDWKANTIYKGEYNPQHKVIKWFWEVTEAFDQEKLANLLKFSTGSSRTPIHGFKKLQSNRGNFSQFIIQSSDFNKLNPYPKGHTCFNRLQLPKYATKELLKTHLLAIVNNNLDGVFGLD